ncbi:Na+/melibiose symporter [Lentzea waywayandensis]|uniref:Na+/melibiose symporter n=1 Tax=Lentzea waywayandensis TaxID=84724 RepID=A0A1I6FH08_9PSEU|nr:MFS transporter [Lentzea waywayandensis]SFR29184.1 Na+/melibiose symporter [Lentzea waywayandensis]
MSTTENLPLPETGTPGDDLPEVSARYIWFLLLALFGTYVAFVTPIALSLAIRVKELAPANEEYLGYVIGVAAAVSLVSGPVAGILSDRTRSRFGRRRPWLVAGSVLGSAGLFVIAIAPDVLVVGVGWVIAALGWNTVIGNITNSQADRLPESQRGKVGGLVGFVTMAAPVCGSVLGGALATNSVLLLMVPATIGVLLVLLFCVTVSEEDSRERTFEQALDFRLLLSKFLFNPRRYRDFSWNWLTRFLFYFGLTLSSTFTAFLLAQRLRMDVTEIGATVALAGLLGVIAVVFGALGSGFVSDRLRRRKPFVLGAGLLFAAGALVMAFSTGLPVLLIGLVITNLGLGVFSAVDQALMLDVMPEKDTDAGRFVAITGLANSLAQSLAPVVAPVFLAIGVIAGGDKNYQLLYIAAACFTLLAGVVVLRVRSVR